MKDTDRDQYEFLAHNMMKVVHARNGTFDSEITRLIDCLVTGKKTARGERYSKHFIMFAAEWAQCGLPHLMTDAKRAAAFMCTDVPTEDLDVIIPWPAFLCTVPAGVLQDGELTISCWSTENSGMMRVSFMDRNIYVRPDGESSGLFWSVCESWKRFDGSAIPENTEQLARNKGVKGENQRILQMVLRFVWSCCAELQAHTSGIGGCPGKPKMKRGEPINWTIRLTRPVVFDGRQAVRDYVQGKRNTLSTQHMRRGHWRNQPYGPKNGLRKLIHVEPCWVGDPNNPIATRPHVL